MYFFLVSKRLSDWLSKNKNGATLKKKKNNQLEAEACGWVGLPVLEFGIENCTVEPQVAAAPAKKAHKITEMCWIHAQNIYKVRKRDDGTRLSSISPF
jgi:hypothetical protein